MTLFDVLMGVTVLLAAVLDGSWIEQVSRENLPLRISLLLSRVVTSLVVLVVGLSVVMHMLLNLSAPADFEYYQSFALVGFVYLIVSSIIRHETWLSS